ncbi:hypothetical protein MK489_04255 [Myxococcota bacterium]|nr:hypothetical protein [Myxococcota bacterium]
MSGRGRFSSFTLLWIFAAGITTGLGLGHSPAAAPAQKAGVAAARPGPAAMATIDLPSAVSSSGLESAATAEEEPEEPEIGEPTAGWFERGPAELAMSALSWAIDPEAVVGHTIDQMSDRELVTVVTSLTDLTDADFDGIRDVRGFARRLSAVAMEGVITDTAYSDPRLPRVEFTSEIDSQGFPVGSAEDFGSGSERIYAVFSPDEVPGEEVLVKWSRSDRRELLLFKHFPVWREDESSFVWIEEPGGWPAGTYDVDIYAANSELPKLSSGQYTVSP